MYYDPQTNQPRRSKVYLVCGAPASGKTTYVKQHKEQQRKIIEGYFHVLS